MPAHKEEQLWHAYSSPKMIRPIASSCSTIAEHVETDAELQVLADIGVGYAQGFRLCEPRSFDTIEVDMVHDNVVAATAAG